MLALITVSVSPAFACTATGFMRDGINMTAVHINPGALATGTVVDATGCNIGVYFSQSGSISGARIYGANYFGVVVDGDGGAVNVDIRDSFIHHIGETPPNGTQHGVAIYYRAIGAAAAAYGDVTDNNVYNYQKGGITVNGEGAVVNTLGNTVTGLGPVDYIAQNGIQYGFGSHGTIRGNGISGNFYTGTVGVGPNPGGENPPGWEYFSAGLLLYQPGVVKHSKNFYAENQHNVTMVP
jgi:hypothetical protein